MRKLLAVLVSFTFYSYASAGVLSREMGTGMPGVWLGAANSVSSTNTDINAAFSNGVSGTALGVRFVSPVTQTSGNFTAYMYLASVTGSPTNTQMDVYPGPSGADDPQRPGSAGVLATVTGVDLTLAGTPPQWSTFTVTGLSLTAGQTYWLVFSNNTGTPASNFPSFANRRLNDSIISIRITGWLTTNGFTTDPTTAGSQTGGGGEFPCVLKFDDGTLMGHPYVLSVAHANNTNDRGSRFRFGSAVKIYGVIASGGIATGATNLKVYQGSTLVSNLALDLSGKNNSSAQPYIFSAPITLSASTDYDFVYTGVTGATATLGYVSANTTSTDILNATYSSQSYVEGTVPGSYNVTNNMASGILLMFDSLPASAGGGGTIMSVFGQ